MGTKGKDSGKPPVADAGGMFPATDKRVPIPRKIRVGSFRVPASLVGNGDQQRDDLINRYRKHVKGLGGSRLPVADLDEMPPRKRQESVTPPRPRSTLETRFSPGRFGRMSDVDDDDDE